MRITKFCFQSDAVLLHHDGFKYFYNSKIFIKFTGAVNILHREPQKPELVIEHREAIVSSGGSAMLELVCKGYPKPNVVFKHDGKVVEADTRHK